MWTRPFSDAIRFWSGSLGVCMKRRIAALVAFALAAALSACSTPSPFRYAMPAEAQPMLGSVEVWTRLDADQIAILPTGFASPAYNSSYETTYGAVPSIAGNLIASLMIEGANQRLALWAEEDIQPLRKALGEHPVAPVIAADLNTRLTGASWLKARPVQMTTATDQTLEWAIANSTASAILWTGNRYYLSDKADRLVIEMWVQVAPVSNDLKHLLAGDEATTGLRPEQAGVLYRNVLSYAAAVEGATTDRVTNVAMWSKDNAAPLRAALKHGSEVLAAALVEDLASAVDLSTEPSTTNTVIRTDEIGSLSRAPGGELIYLTRTIDVPLVAVPETERPGSKISKKPPPGSFY